MLKKKLLHAQCLHVATDFYALLAHVIKKSYKNRKCVKQIGPSVLQECTGTQSCQMFFKSTKLYSM